jgi:hypothetical protein
MFLCIKTGKSVKKLNKTYYLDRDDVVCSKGPQDFKLISYSRIDKCE